MEGEAASRRPSRSIARWSRLPAPARRALVTARRLSHPGHRPRPTVEVQISRGVAVIIFDDGKVNAVSRRMASTLAEGLDRAESDRRVRAVVLAGRPGQFCAGFDLDTLMIGGKERRQLMREAFDLLLRLHTLPLPLVVACTGNAIALGAALLLSGDWRIGADGDFKIGFNEAAIGLPVPRAFLTLAADRLAEDAYEEATLHARMHSPGTACDAGFLQRVVTPAGLLPAAIVRAQELGDLPPGSFRAQKESRTGEVARRMQAEVESDLALIEQLGR